MSSMPQRTELDPAEIVEAHQTGVWRYLRALGCDPHEAADLVQDTFLIVLQKPFRQYSDAATAGYLRKVARNLFISAKRREGRVMTFEQVDAIDGDWTRWSAHDNGEELLAALGGCFDSLGDRAQLALDMRFRERSSRNEIADALKMSEHGAKNLMQRAKKRLRECVDRKMSTDAD